MDQKQLNAYPPLPAETEETARRIIGCAIEVHRRLGPGYLESIYGRARRIELDTKGLSYEAESRYPSSTEASRFPGSALT